MAHPQAIDPDTAPRVVMFVRHGEKPGEHGPPHGINHIGEHDEHSLSVRGWTRAGALAALMSHAPVDTHQQLVAPERIIATKPNHKSKSRREVDTATPLAKRLGLSIDDDFEHGHEKALAASLLTDPRDAFVVWHHGSVVHVVEEFPIANREDVPANWPDDRFDLIWVLARERDQRDYRFVSIAQDLLDGDAQNAR